MAIELYGLDKCDTCKKARQWLVRKNIEHVFIDYREQRVEPAALKRWAESVGGFDKLVNRTGTTWRNLATSRKSPGSDAEWTLLIKEYPALVRRPVLVIDDGSVSVGFSDALFSRRLDGVARAKEAS